MEQAIVIAGTVIAVGLIFMGVGVGSAIGDGLVASKALEGMARQPELTSTILRYMFIFIGIVESFPVIVLAFAFWFLFANPFLPQLGR